MHCISHRHFAYVHHRPYFAINVGSIFEGMRGTAPRLSRLNFGHTFGPYFLASALFCLLIFASSLNLGFNLRKVANPYHIHGLPL